MREEQGDPQEPFPCAAQGFPADHEAGKPAGEELRLGTLGGDQQIGVKIVEGQIDFMIFLWDPLEAEPHDPDVKALLKIAVVYDIPIANNLATADFMLHSEYMDKPYERRVENFDKTIRERVEKMKQ